MSQAIQSLMCCKGNIPPVTQSWAVSLLCAGTTVYTEQIQQAKKTCKQRLKVGLDLQGSLPTPIS